VKACVSLEGDQVGHGWGRVEQVAVAEVDDGQITSWTVHDVRWGTLHDTGTEGAHHARVVRFLREQGIELVVTHHMGQGQYTMIGKLGIRVVLDAQGDARTAVLTAAGG
jgi:predicted Fe-Mo cluster-binding NifX family protein